ncbi:Pentatricopeptide repeat-containing protein, mitochondrial [Heracleum sosnowskyi]|uniref:Pentatricopeptide repeat-containing protein, mitochondrial n=1 Tax=Heracleum sosnowskyi TaxID=360622 RepID=A0AAD8J5Z2_9APIA|nr:Pentatricopeptide repeat-containing protein, mitochondrial [Heracleum sosnowskyi]
MNIYKRRYIQINPILHHAKPLLPLPSRFLTASAANVTNTYTLDNEEQLQLSFDSSCIIQDKDLLHKTHDGGLRVLELIDSGSIKSDASFYNKLLNECAKLGRVKEGKVVHEHFSRSRFWDYQVVLNSVVNMYAKCGCLEDARKVFDEMPVRDVVTWTALITGFSQHERYGEALRLFPEFLSVGLEPNHFTFSSLIKAAGGMGSGREGRQIHGFCLKYGYDGNVYAGSALVDMYVRCGLMEDGERVFRGLSSKNDVSWNALIAGHARRGEGESAVRVFKEMQREDFKATHFTYSSVFSACANIGALEQGKWVHAHMIKSGIKLVAFVGHTLLDMYSKSGSITDAIKVFDRLVKRDVVSWNSLLTACAQHGRGRETIRYFKKMLKIGIKPNAITFLCVLTACSHAGLLEQGEHYFNLMKKYDIEPDTTHYVTVVDLLGRAGDFHRAEMFIRNMPFEPDAAVWKALLGACRMHKNAELGAYAAEQVFKLDPNDSGPHIILYNIYASAGRWEEAAKARKAMRERGVKKEPACSWVEIENAVHMFVANDDTHPHREEIFKMWEKISQEIKKIGYVPDPSHVLLFVDQQEREAKLQYHSEKLALAFALLNTPDGSTIRIKKNIRVCGDCHSAFKFVSKLVEREIILRDTNRFHHFSDGLCSCGDYW